jgi:Uma2 family endonuclease
MSTFLEPLPGTLADPLYPDSDGKPMAETDYHASCMVRTRELMGIRFRDEEDVYVCMDMFLYYEQGNPRARRAPDVMLVKGVGKHFRRSFRIWEEKVDPWVIFEITSRKTRKVDLVRKPAIYQQLRVKEYFLFDPLGEYLKPRLQGFRLKDNTYQAIAPEPDGSLVSEELGLILEADGWMLQFRDRETGERILSNEEQAADAQKLAEEFRHKAEEEQRRFSKAQRQIQEEQRRTQEAQRKADEEKQRIAVLEAEVARLRAALRHADTKD